MHEILTCPICGREYENIGSIPQICLTCWDKLYLTYDKIKENC